MTELCISCEAGTATEHIEDRVVVVDGGHSYQILADHFMRCDNCSEEYYTDEQSRENARKVSDARRVEEGLLTGGQIQQIRRSLMLSQAELEEALGVAKKTVIRWELGTSVQSKAADDVLRLIAFDADNLRLLVRVRKAAMAPLVDKKLLPQDDKNVGCLKEAVYTGLERANVHGSIVQQVTASVVEAILESRKEHIVNSAPRALGASA
jgi:HTH-type transcriptional regulator / antitoxin MqsA